MSDLPTKPPLVYSFPLRSRAQSLERQFHSVRGRQSQMLCGMADGRRSPYLHPTAFYCPKEPYHRGVLLRISSTYLPLTRCFRCPPIHKAFAYILSTFRTITPQSHRAPNTPSS